MSYDYKTQRAYVFTEEGQLKLLSMRDLARKHIELSGAVCYEALTAAVTGSSWDALACVDRLCEIGDLIRVEQAGRTQDDVFVSKRWKYKEASKILLTRRKAGSFMASKVSGEKVLVEPSLFSNYAKQEEAALLLMHEKSKELLRRLDVMGVKYTVLYDSVEIDATPDQLEAVQNLFRELWTDGSAIGKMR